MDQATEVFQQGGVIAYPTEAVFGLGCDPDNEKALEKLLAIKQRPKSKGLILLAGTFEQLLPYIDISSFSASELELIVSRWPDGITQVLPAKANLTSFLTGDFETIAVRVTSQADVVALCSQTNKPIVSTSANLSGLEPATTWQTLDPKLKAQIDFVIKGKTLGFTKASTIIDAVSGNVYRS